MDSESYKSLLNKKLSHSNMMNDGRMRDGWPGQLLQQAVLYDNVDFLQCLLEGLCAACSGNDMEGVKEVLRESGPNKEQVLNMIPDGELPPLCGASQAAVLKDVTMTPLTFAFEHHDLDIMKLLLEAGAEDAENRVLQGAFMAHDQDVVSLLLQFKAVRDLGRALNKTEMWRLAGYSGGGGTLERTKSGEAELRPKFLASAVAIQWQGLMTLLQVDMDCVAEASRRLNPALKALDDAVALCAITKVDISGNSFQTFPAALLTLPSLVVVNASKNKIAAMPEEDDPLTMSFMCPVLEELHLQQNKLTALPVYIFRFPALKFLDASHNKISELPSEMWLAPSVVTLDLSHNLLVKLPQFSKEWSIPRKISMAKRTSGASLLGTSGFQGRLEGPPSVSASVVDKDPWKGSGLQAGLKQLKLCRNKFTAFPNNLACCASNLEVLDLSENALDCVGPISDLPPTLTELNLSRLESIVLTRTAESQAINADAQSMISLESEEIQTRLLFPALTDLDLSVNLLRSLTSDIGEQADLKILSLRGNRNLHEDFLQNSRYPVRDILGFLLSVLEEVSNEEVKERVRSQTLSTVGIDINELIFDCGSKGVVNFRTWDFGGQREYYATHQYFLSPRSLYLVMWNIIDGERGVEGLQQWLVNIQARAPGAPVIIVGTHVDILRDKATRRNFPPDFEEAMVGMVRKLFINNQEPDKCGLPCIIDTVNISCKTGENVRKLVDLIKHNVFELKHPRSRTVKLLGQKIPRKYLLLQTVVRELALERIQDFKEPYEVYRKRLCVSDRMMEKGYTTFRDVEELEQATRFLHENGVLFHWDDLALRDLYFLDPQWLCDQLAKVVTVREINSFAQRGVMRISNLEFLFRSTTFQPEDVHQYITSLLAKFEVALQFDDEHLFNPIFSFCRLYFMTYFPSGFWSRLIVRVLADTTLYSVVRNLFRLPRELLEKSPEIRTLVDRDPEWHCWQTGLELFYLGFEMLRVREVTLSLGTDPQQLCDYSQCRFKCSVEREWCYLDMANSRILEITFPTDVLRFHVSTRDGPMLQTLDLANTTMVPRDEQATGKLLVKMVEHIDNLLQDWYPELGELRFHQNCEGRYLVTRIVPCPQCLAKEVNRQRANRREDDSWFFVNPEAPDVYSPLILTPDKDDSDGAGEQSTSGDGEMSGNRLSGSGQNRGIPDGQAFIYNRENSGESSEPVIFSYLVERCMLDVMQGVNTLCPVHGSVSPQHLLDSNGISHPYYIAPDVVFNDLPVDVRITNSDQVEVGLCLGEGNFGKVYEGKLYRKGFQTRLEAACSAYLTARQEVSILEQLSHPNIVPFLGLALQPLSLVLGLAPNGALSSVAKSLAYLHSNNIIYRDLKSENVLVWDLPLSHDDPPDALVHIKIADYGISRTVLPTGAKGFGGTAPFIAPEILQHAGKGTYTEKVDIFSLGMFIFELATCRFPFIEMSNPNTLVCQGGRPSLTTQEVERCPTYLLDLLSVCWSQDPADRPSSANVVTMLGTVVAEMVAEEFRVFRCYSSTLVQALDRCELWLGQGSGSILVWDVTMQASVDCLYHSKVVYCWSTEKRCIVERLDCSAIYSTVDTVTMGPSQHMEETEFDEKHSSRSHGVVTVGRGYMDLLNTGTDSASKGSNVGAREISQPGPTDGYSHHTFLLSWLSRDWEFY
nr:hypothetical protein BaRGS_024428 [Batillaria attramentaria]